MKCLKPIFISYKAGRSQLEKNPSGNQQGFLVDCSNCKNCQKMKAWRWHKRLHDHSKTIKGYCITGTFNEENVKKNHTDLLDFITKFYKRLRWHLKKENHFLQHFTVREAGSLNGRLHFHAIIFTDYPLKLFKAKGKYYYCEFLYEIYQKVGMFKIDLIKGKNICYVLKYIQKNTYKGEVNKIHRVRLSYKEKQDSELVKVIQAYHRNQKTFCYSFSQRLGIVEILKEYDQIMSYILKERIDMPRVSKFALKYLKQDIEKLQLPYDLSYNYDLIKYKDYKEHARVRASMGETTSLLDNFSLGDSLSTVTVPLADKIARINYEILELAGL